MLRKYAKYVIVSFILILILLIVYHVINDNPVKDEFYLPSVKLLTNEGDTLFLNKEVENKKNIVLSFLSSECLHCKFQGMDIESKSELYKDWEHILIVEQSDSVESFLKKTGLHSSSNYKLTFANYTLIDQFNIKGFPSTLVFDKNGKLIKEIPGEMKVEKIISAITKCVKN